LALGVGFVVAGAAADGGLRRVERLRVRGELGQEATVDLKSTAIGYGNPNAYGNRHP
jgi:hypothetical protein